MQLKAEQLAAQLSQGLSPVYLIYGDEHMLVEESSDIIRQSAKRAGVEDRQTWHVEGRFDWSQIKWQEQTMSLFSSQRLLEIRLPSGSPGKDGGEAIRRYCDNPPDDTFLLIISGKIDAKSKKSKWFTAIDKLGVTVPIWPVGATELPAWISRRMQQKGLSASQTAKTLLAERVEGNLFAAAQEIEKLTLLAKDGQVEDQLVLDSVADNARFQAFGLMDAVYAGQAEKVPRMLDRLKAEGNDFLAVFSAVSWSLHRMVSMAIQASQGENLDRIISSQRPTIIYKSQPIIQNALRRYSVQHWQKVLVDMAEIDAAAKGANLQSPWLLLESLCLKLAGIQMRKQN